MPINKSYGQEMDKRTRELEKRSTGSDANALQEQQLAQNQLQAIQNEQRSNLMSQRTEAAAMAQQNQLLSQAAELGVSDSTAATLGKYGMKTPPRVQRQQGRQVNVTPNKITIINNTNTTTTNNNQVQGGGGDNGSASKFKTWLTKVNMQQAEQASKRDRDYARRESSLTRSANKMLRRIEKVGSSVAEAFSPKSFGQTLGSQLKMYLLIFGMRFLSKYWDKVLYVINWIGKAFQDFTAWLGIGEKGSRESAQGRGLVPTIIRLFGGDPRKESVSDAFRNSLKAAFDHFSDKLDHMMQERAEAMKKVKLNVKTDGALGGILKGLGLESLFQGVTTYLGDILTALVNPKAGAARQVARSIQKKGFEGSVKHMNTDQYKSESFGTDKGDLAILDKSNKHRYGLVAGTIEAGNVLTSRKGGQLSQSLDVLGALKDAQETGYVDPARFLAGLERMQNKARTDGFIAVDYEFLSAFLSPKSIQTLTAAGHIRLRRYKIVKEKKARLRGRTGDYVSSVINPMAGFTAGAVQAGAHGAGKGMMFVEGAISAVPLLGPAVMDYLQNDNTLSIVPLDDPREAYKGQTVVLYEIDEHVLKQIAQQFGASRFDSSNEKLITQIQRYMYQKAGGYAATQGRWKGKGKNESINIAEEYKSIHDLENLRAAHETEEKNDEFSRRHKVAMGQIKEIGQGVVNTAEDIYGGVKDFITKPTGDSPEVLYSPSDHVTKTGYGPRTADMIESYQVPPTPKYGEIRPYSGKSGTLKSPMSTEYTFSTEAAAKEAERLCRLVISDLSPSKWKAKAPGARDKSNFKATYARLAIAKGLGTLDLKDRPRVPCEFADILYKYGFCPINWEGFSPRKGDICVFGPTSKHKGGYVSIYSGNRWISDFEQSEMWPYDDFKAERCATIFRHLRTISDKSYEDLMKDQIGIDAGYGGSGLIDFDDDGKWDAMRTEDGSFYRLKEDGSIEKMSTEEVQSLWNSNSVFSSSSNFGDSDSTGFSAFVGENVGATHYDSWTMSRAGFGTNKWANAVMAMGAWYKSHFTKYSNTCTFGCQLLPGRGKVRPDCSGFVSACLVLYGIPVYNPDSDRKEGNGGPMARLFCVPDGRYTAAERSGAATTHQKLTEGGFTLIPRSELSKVGGLQPWDIIASYKHVEVTADGKGQSYNAGSTDAITKGMPRSDKPFLSNFTHVWRCTSTPSHVGKNSILDSKGDDVNFGAWDAPADLASGGSSYGGGDSYGWVGNTSSSPGGGYTGSAAITGDQAKQNAISMVNFLVGKGLTKEQALGIAGNLMAESGFNPNAIGDRGTSGGFAQWHDTSPGRGRFTNLQNFAKARGKSWTDPGVQAEFLWHELTEGGYKNVLAKIKNASTPEESARIWGRYFEGFRGSDNAASAEYSKRIAYANSLGESYGHYGSEKGVNFTGGGDAATQAAGEAIEQVEDAAKKAAAAVQTVYNDIKLAASGALLPLKEGKQYITLEKDSNKKIEAMSEDQLAAQIWLNNEMIRSQYDSYGFKGWKKNVFDNLPKKDKQRYLIEAEGQALFAATTTTSDGSGIHWTGLRNVLGYNIDSKYYDSSTGQLTPEGLSWFSRVYATLSPAERTNLVGRLRLERDWRDTKNDIKEKYAKGDYTEEELDNVRNLLKGSVYSGDTFREFGRDKKGKSWSKSSEFLNSFYKSAQLGDVSTARALLEKVPENTFSGTHFINKEGKYQELSEEQQMSLAKILNPKSDTHYYDEDLMPKWKAKELFRNNDINDTLARTFAKEQYDIEQEKINKFLESDVYKSLKDFKWGYIDSPMKRGEPEGTQIEKSFRKLFGIIPNFVKRDGKYQNHYNLFGDTGKGLHQLTEDYSKYLNGMYNLFKSKYIQQHLVEGFEDILETDTGEQAYEKNRRNKERAKINREKYDLQYRMEHWQDDYSDRMEKDEKFRRNMLWKYGRGYEANEARHNSQEGLDETAALNKSLQELNEKLGKLNGSKGLQDVKSIQDKFSKIKSGETVVSAEEFKKINNYATTGAQVYDETRNKLEAERNNLKAGYHWENGIQVKDTVDWSKVKSDFSIQKEAEEAMYKHVKEDVWQSLMNEVAKGTKSVQEARYILDQQGLGNLVTNDQLLNIKKTKKYGENLLRTVSETDKDGNVVTKFLDAEGKAIQVEDYERDKDNNIVYDKKTGRPKMKKRDATLDDTEKMVELMDQMHQLQSVQGIGKGDVTMKIGGKELSLYSDGMGEMFYYDPETGRKYDRSGTLIGSWATYNGPGAEMLGNMGPQLVSAATNLQQLNFQKRLDSEEGYSYAGEKFSTKEGAKVNTRQLDMSQYQNLDEMLTAAASKFGEAFTEQMKNELTDQYNTDKNAKVEISTIRKNGMVISGAVVNGDFKMFPDDQLAARELNAMEQHAKKLGFSSEEAKLYADNQFRQQSSWAEIQKRMSAENISIEGIIATSLDGISQQLVTIQNTIGVEARDRSQYMPYGYGFPNVPNAPGGGGQQGGGGSGGSANGTAWMSAESMSGGPRR